MSVDSGLAGTLHDGLAIGWPPRSEVWVFVGGIVEKVLEDRAPRAVWERPVLVRMDAVRAEAGPGMAVEMIGGGTGDNGMMTS